MHRIQPTRLEYQDTHTPFSPLFDDVYFAAQQGIEESTYVYLEGTGLSERLQRESQSPLQLLEIGFGVGLNFLLSLRKFKASAHPSQRLIYFSIEKHPVYEQDLRELYSRFPELEADARELLDQYPVLTPGFHTLSFCKGRVRLVLMLGEAQEMLSRLEANIDLWYWDGFAPSKNPDAFSESIFQQVARLSAKGAQGASFTSAGWVRRALESAGFKVEKTPGYGKKRECIRAEYLGPQHASMLPAWFSNQKLTHLKTGDRIAVVGAGLSGSAIARVLADRGFSIAVFDPNGIAHRASGNSVGLFNVQLSKLPNPISRFSQLSLIHFLRELNRYPLATRSGIFRGDETTTIPLETSEYPSDFYEHTERDGKPGILFSKCGILNPRTLCETRLNHPRIQLIVETATRERLREWDHIVYAMGADGVLPGQALVHADLEALPVRPIRGQTLEVQASDESKNMTETWVNQGYLSPVAPEISGNDHHLIGATYQAKNVAPNQEELDTIQLIEETRTRWPSFQNLSHDQVVSHRVGYRLSTPDKLPLIGPVCNPQQLKTDYERALKGSKTIDLPALSVREKEWMLLGMGSRGITFSSLSSEILASLMVGEPLPVELDLWEHLHSARFWIRNLKRNELR